MNVNQEILELETITGLPVSQDIYTGTGEKYITFTYNTENPVFWGDDEVMEDETVLQVNLYTPVGFNYMGLKHTIRDYLETIGIVNSIGSWLDTFTVKNNLEKTIRHTNFVVTITKERY